MTIRSHGARKVRIPLARFLARCIARRIRRCIGLMLIFSAPTLLADALDKPPPQSDDPYKSSSETVTMPTEQVDAEFRRMADEKTRIFLNDLSARRRITTMFANRQSVTQGAQENFVNTSSGNLTFMVRDMVRIGGMPIVLGRVYDSSLTSGADFGPGWKLTVEERIVADGSGFIYTDAAGAAYRLKASGDEITPAVAAWTPIRSGAIRAGGNVIVLESEDLWRRFKRMGDVYRLVAVSHSRGSLRLEYRRDGLLGSISSENGSVTLTRREDGRIVSARDDLGRSVAYEYDEAGRLVRSLDLGGEPWKYRYAVDGTAGQLAEVTDPRGKKVLEVRYQDDRAAMVRALRTKVNFVYDEGITKASDVLGRTTTFHFASSGVTEGITDPSGVFTQVTFDDQHRPVEIMRDGALKTRLDYDAQGRLESMLRDNGDSTKFVYNRHGIIAAFGAQEARYRYRDGRLAYAEDAQGTRSYQYDKSGVLNAMKKDGNEIQLEVDANGLITRVEQAGERLMEYAYDPQGRVKTIGFDHGDRAHMVSYRYNQRGFREAANYSYGTDSRIHYDATGNMIRYAATDPDGKTVTQDYEIGDYNEVLRIRNGGVDSPDVSYQYDEAGRVYDMQAGDRIATVSYDHLDRATHVTLDGETLLKYDYEALETDAISKTDALSGEVWVARGTSIVFGTMESIVYSRPRPVEFGPVAYEPALKTLYVETHHLAPDQVLLSSLARRIIPFEREAVNANPFGTDKPSSSLFIPPEYRAVNCSICSYRTRGLTITLEGIGGYSALSSLRPRSDYETFAGLWTTFKLSANGDCHPSPGSVIYRWGSLSFGPSWIYSVNYGDGNSSVIRTVGNGYRVTARHVYDDYGYRVLRASLSCACNSPFTISRASKGVRLRDRCSLAHRDGFASLTLSIYPREPFERGFEWRCRNSGRGYYLTYATNSDPHQRARNVPYTPPWPLSAPYDPPPSPNDPDPAPLPPLPTPGIPGNPVQFNHMSRLLNFTASSGSRYIDPCVTLLPLRGPNGVAHTHPYFETSEQFNAGFGCQGSRGPKTATFLANHNRDGEDFSTQDIKTAIDENLRSYLLTPIDRDIRVYDQRRGHWYSTIVVDRNGRDYDPRDYD